MNMPILEPRNGDFVAYLEEIEKRQIALTATLPPPSFSMPRANAPVMQPPPPAGQHAQPAQANQRVQPASKSMSNSIGLLVLLAMGALFAGLGLVGETSLIAVPVGIFLIWRALKLFSGQAARKTGADNGQSSGQSPT
jgi:hypothetical protein